MLIATAALTFLSLAGLVRGTGGGAPLLKRSLQPGLAGNAAWDGSTYRCPAGSNIFLEKWCCPDGYEYDMNSGQFTSYICCPVGGAECSKQVLNCPICADSSWSYWDIGGTNVPPTLPYCCEEGYAPADLAAPQPANVCTSGANLWTDYASASQCGGQAAAATGSASPGSASASASATSTPTDSSQGGSSSSSAEATPSASATSGSDSGSGARINMSYSSLALFMAMSLPGMLMLMM